MSRKQQQTSKILRHATRRRIFENNLSKLSIKTQLANKSAFTNNSSTHEARDAKTTVFLHPEPSALHAEITCPGFKSRNHNSMRLLNGDSSSCLFSAITPALSWLPMQILNSSLMSDSFATTTLPLRKDLKTSPCIRRILSNTSLQNDSLCIVFCPSF